MLCLPKPFGWPSGTPISIVAREHVRWKVNGDVVAGIVLGWGCPSFILPRIASAINASGRYDCRVTVSRLALDNLRVVLDQIEVDLVIVEEINLVPHTNQFYR